MRKGVGLACLGAYGLLNAVLYSSLLPLWEGFDEPFHYGYVQALSVGHTFPVLGRTPLSDEIWTSVRLVPASHVVKQNIPGVISFSEYFRLTHEERAALRQQLASLDPKLRTSYNHHPLNYEAHQAPLAYMILAGPDSLWAGLPLPARIWRLRLVCAVFSALAVVLLTLKLARQLRIPPLFQIPLLFVLLCCQMLYATTAHISNDWLGIPLFALFFVSAISLCDDPSGSRTWGLALALSSALLTKAYSLALLPVALALLVWLAYRGRIRWLHIAAFSLVVLATSGVWYGRNVVLYRSISGMQETVGALASRDVWSAFWNVPWLAAVTTLARKSLWTGNNSDLAFSSATISLMWAALTAAGALYVATAFKRGVPIAERVLVASAVTYGAGLAYATALGYAFTGGAATSPAPWYTQPMLSPLLCLLFVGLSRSGQAGRALATLIVCLWGYVLFATYWAKLIPLYGGWDRGPVRLATLFAWYAAKRHDIPDVLATTALVNGNLVLLLAAVVGLAALAAPVAVSWTLLRRPACPA